MKKYFKSTFAVAILAVSATMGYVSYNQYQNQQLAFANPLLEENIEALADYGGVSTMKWRNTHIPMIKDITPYGTVIYSDSIFKGDCSGRICNSEEAIKQAKKEGYYANSCHSHGFQICTVDLTKL